MNYFWDVVDWLLPPVRIIDDLADHPSESSYRKTTHHHSSHPSRRLSGKEHDRDRDRDRERRREKEKERERGSWRDRERTRERERPRERERTRDREREREREVRASSDADKEREQLRQRVQQLERENDSLLEQLRSTREELSRLSTAVFPTPDSRASQPLPASYPASPTDALGLVHPVPPAHTPTPTPISPTSSTSPAAAQYSAEAALTDPKRLRVLYTSLRATYTDARQTIRSQAEELASLKGFLSKTDDWSGAQLLQALADLNSEIIQLAASVAEEFAADLRADVRAPAVAKERDREVVRGALGREMLRLLEGREHAPDPTLVQFALQAWEVWCVTRVMDAFCYGLPPDVDESLRRIFDRMQRQEPQPTTSRWRALTYRHARSLLTPRLAASEVSTPDTATPSPFNSAPASIASSSALPAQLLSLTEANLRGVLAILALAGCTDARGLHREPLRARYGSALARISARAERISGVVKEGVLSGLFEVVWCQPCRASPKAKPAALGVGVGVGVGAEAANGSGSAAEAAAADPAQPAKLDGIDINEIGANRGKGKEREWVEEVERARNGVDEEAREREQEQLGAKEMFDWATMENVYAGHCNERCRVLCTVELGLAFTRRLPAEEREESVDGDGMVVSHASAGSRPVSSLSRPASMGGVGLDGMAGGNVSLSRSRSSANGTVTVVDGNRMVRNLLLKPKVLLESVVDIL